MRRIILISFLFISFLAKAQQYTNFQGYGFKANRIWADSVSIQPSDTVRNKVAKSVAILNNKLYVADGTKWIIAGGGAVDTFSLSTRAWRQKGIDSVVALLNNVTVDSFIYSTRAWRQKGIDSVSSNVNLRVKYTDTASMLSPYLRTANATTGTVTSVATNYGLSGGTITTSGTLSADTSKLSTKAWRQKGIDSVQANLTTGLSTKLSSVGLTMPSAFSVANSPLTSNGTLAVTGAGTSSQYVRGDGSLGIFPTVGGGGGGSVYYLNGNTSQGSIGGTTMYQLSKLAASGTSANFTRSTTGTIASFITDAGDPNQLTVPSGIWVFEIYFSESGGGANHATIQAIVEKWNGTSISVIGTGVVEEITNGNVKDLYTLGVSIPSGITLSLTDRIVIQFQIANANGKTVTLYTENGNISSVTTTFANGISSINGLTAAAQTLGVGTSGTDFGISSTGSSHTFNLPTASATNRGALSTTDWSTFNSKIGASDTATMLSPYSRGSGTSGQVGYWNATRSLTGSSGFTFTPTTSLLLNNSVTAASAIARGQNITSTLTAAANGDVLVGLDVNPTFSIGSFTGTSRLASRFTGNVLIGQVPSSIVAYTYVPLTLSNNATGALKTQLSLLNGGGSTGAGSAIDFFTYTDAGNGSPGIRIAGVDDGNYSGNFQLLTKGNGSAGGGNLTNKFQIFGGTGNILIQSGGTFTDAGYKLDVNGTARVQDALTVSKNQNSSTILTISNTTAGSGSQANMTLTSDATAGNGQLFKYSSSRPAYKTIGSSDLGFYNGIGGNISILNDFASGNINFTAGASSNAQLTIASSGNITQSVNQNAATTLKVSNTTSGTASESILLLTSNNGNFQFGKSSSTKTAFKTIFANDGYIFNDVSGNISILNNFTTGNINFAAGGSSTAQATLASTGNLLLGTTTDAGYKLDVNGTARVQGLFSALNTSTQGIILANNTGSYPAVEFWDGSKRAEIVRETNNGLTIRAGTFSMFTSTNGTLVGGTSLSDLNASAQLQVQSTTKGFLPPRMTTAQRDLISSPAAGLIIYNTSTNKHQGYNGSTWNDFY